MNARRLLLQVAALATAAASSLAASPATAEPPSPGPERVSPGPQRVSAGPQRVAPGPERVSAGPQRVAAAPQRVAPGPSGPQTAPGAQPAVPPAAPAAPATLAALGGPTVVATAAAPGALAAAPGPLAAAVLTVPATATTTTVAATATTIAATSTPVPWRALVLGGGPKAPMNQVAIEGHVRYFQTLLPDAIERRVLFADGNRFTPTVQYLEGDRLFYRPTRLQRIDGPTTLAGVDRLWRGFVTARPSDPLLLYFAGHGSPDRGRDLDNNVFDLWGGGGLSVRDLAARIEQLPPSTPVVLVMAQCFSGAFANVLFEGGDPEADPVDRDLVGFFAATRDRPASGCTPEINEADYTDFSSYFFAALSGQDRLGRAVDDADFDGDKQVGMHEAYAYAVIHQATSDVPIATSDVFLRRFVPTPDRETMTTPYSKVLAWARPAERAALEALAKELGLRGEDRMRTAYALQFGPGSERVDWDDVEAAHRLRFIRLAKTVVLAHTLRETGDPALVARFDRLRAAESRNPLVEARPAP
ncbi:hypothetical protein [Chondromyces apiculatus]|uniref:Uncharacterized protein n=1 Tax=Chondromyces apiculatus DSM 436 TaxID=1192034 RepID=A0A017TIW6_9BACT|nr:hypothetical protein [Chondromyces apiculatus]EYF08531.1 Hypothetical protein CAP_4061 [Chondromyces apiculatus DSM 436]